MKITALLLTTLVLSGCALKPTVESELIGQARPAVAVSDVVMVESTPGAGSIFRLILPLAPERKLKSVPVI